MVNKNSLFVFRLFSENLFKSSRVNFLDESFGLGLVQRAGVISVELLEVSFGLLVGVVESERFDDLLSFRKIFKKNLLKVSKLFKLTDRSRAVLVSLGESGLELVWHF